jgi:nickel transport protein
LTYLLIEGITTIMKKALFLSLLALSASIALPAQAHFQLLYTPNVNLQKAGDVPLKLVFWHPMGNGHVMDMGQPVDFFSVFKGKKTDLLPSLKPITFKGRSNEAAAYDANIQIKRNGDYILALVPSPYLEKSEDIYIQQITKSYINKGEIPTSWNEPLGLKTEIVPLNKPYGSVAGSTFSGVVLRNGQPVPNLEIEVEYMSAEPDMDKSSPNTDTNFAIPGGALSVITDSAGKFTFGIPKAGFWGFAALGSGPDNTYNGKELSQDAVLWIKAHEMGE